MPQPHLKMFADYASDYTQFANTLSQEHILNFVFLPRELCCHTLQSQICQYQQSRNVTISLKFTGTDQRGFQRVPGAPLHYEKIKLFCLNPKMW